MKQVNSIMKAFTKTISKLEAVASKNIAAVEANDDDIRKLRESNKDLRIEAATATAVASNLKGLMIGETE